MIFNFCMNPLLSKIDKEGAGYRINEECRLTIQAYADDIVTFADTREGLQANLDIVDSFLKYAKIQVNANKCHTISYVYRDRKRIYEEEPFSIANEFIPVSNLAESVEYLGIDATTTNKIRKHGAMAAVEKMCNLVKKIGESSLALNQKLYAIKTFAIPQLDYVLINKRIDNKTTDDIDRLIRTTINKHVKGVKLPVSLFYTHWKDGGFSLLKIKERTLCLRAKTFMALYNSKSKKTRLAIRAFTESERRYRNIKTIGKEDEELFLDWKIEESMKRGTDTIAIHALRSIKKLDMVFKIDPDSENIVAKIKTIYNNSHNTEGIPEEVIGEPACKYSIATSAKELSLHITRNIREFYRNELVSNIGTGHSFHNIKDAAYANKFIGDYKHELNDNIASWIVKARCNLLFTGALALKTRIPVNLAPHCPYCNTLGDDTIAHRINGCLHSRREQTKRHNNIQNVILQYMMDRLGRNYRYRTNCTLNIEGKRLDNKFDSLKPDITAYDKDKIIIVEFSCPYANINSEGYTLDNVRSSKEKKYIELAEECKKIYKKKVSIYTIIVSSLGAIHEKSINDIKSLLKIGPSEKKLTDTILRRLSLTACIGSYFIYNKLMFKEYKVDCKDNTAEGDIQEGINDDSMDDTREEIRDDTLEPTREEINIGTCSEDEEEEAREDNASTCSMAKEFLTTEEYSDSIDEGTQLHNDDNNAHINSEDEVSIIEAETQDDEQ